MTPRRSLRGAMCATMVLLCVGRAAEAQDTASTASGNIRELVCRGKPGIALSVHSDSVAEVPGFVAMVLRYDRVKVSKTLVQSGMGNLSFGNSAEFIPGACSWGYGFIPDVPAEPGVVYFDLARDAQAHVAPGARDTTIDVAAHFPDLISLPRYLSDSTRYWVFYVDDVSHVAASHGRWPLGGAYAETDGSVRDASTTRSAVGAMTGSVSGVLATDSAARRTDATRVGTSIKASSTSGTSSVSGGITGGVRDASAQRSVVTAGSSATERNRTDASSAVGRLVQTPIRLVAVNTVLDRFTIEFTARPNASPSVRYSTAQPVRQGDNGPWTFPGGVVQGSGAVEGGIVAAVAGGAGSGLRATYTAWTRVAPERGKVYHYIITIPATTDRPTEQHVGQLTTVAQHARVVYTMARLIKSWSFTQLNLFAGDSGAAIELRPAQGDNPLTGVERDVVNAPDQLDISVYGTSWVYDPNRVSDQAGARVVLNIGISPLERYVRIPFRMSSNPGSVWQLFSNKDPKPPSVIAFEMEGYVEVTRR